MATIFYVPSVQAKEQAPAAGKAQIQEEDDIIVEAQREALLEGTTSTASRLNLEIRETPAAIDVLTQERFLERGLRTSNDALNSAAGVTAMDGGGGTNFSMRGFNSNATISTNWDGVHQPSSMTQRNYDSFAFDRVEVLKGPSSVLYGEGALAGAINYVPKKPILGDTAFTGVGQYGSRDSFRVAGDANVPLGEAAAVRAVASYAGTDGYIDRAKTKTVTANLRFLAQPAPNFSVLLSGEYGWEDNRARYWGTPLVSSTVAERASGLVTSSSNGRVLDLALRDINYQYDDGYVTSRNVWLRSQVTWVLSNVWTLRNDFSYNKSDRFWRDAESYSFNSTYDGGAGGINREATDIRNQLEFFNNRLALSADSKLFGRRNRFLIGYERTFNKHNQLYLIGKSTATDLRNTNPGSFPDLTPTSLASANEANDNSGKIILDALFAEDALNVTDKLLLIAGGRIEWMDLDREINNYLTGSTTQFNKRYKPFSYRFGSVYDLTDKAQLYAQWTQAAAPIATLVRLSAANSAFKLTKGKSAEVGIKSSLFDNRLDLTVSAYWIRQSNILTRDPDNDSRQFQGGVQSSRGVEVAASAKITQQLRLDANATVLDARFDELIESGGNDRKGNTPSNVPERVVNLFGVYQFAKLPVKLTGGMRYSSHIYGDNANTVRVDGYTVYDASVGYTFAFGDLTLRARNLTNKTYVNWAGSSSVYLAAPRTIDVTLRTKF